MKGKREEEGKRERDREGGGEKNISGHGSVPTETFVGR